MDSKPNPFFQDDEQKRKNKNDSGNPGKASHGKDEVPVEADTKK